MKEYTSDPYAFLGLSRDAGMEEVRRVFRRLAMLHHPDRPGGSSEKFRKVCEAYRRITERAGLMPLTGWEGQGFSPPPRGPDVFEYLELDLEQVVWGASVTVRYLRRSPCPECLPRPEDDCPRCLGAGRIFRPALGALYPEPCPECRGRGSPAKPCPACGGNGLVEGLTEVRVRVPCGIEDGLVLRLPGQGHHPRPPDFLPGDLRLVMRIKPHPLFHAEGRNLHLRRFAGAYDAEGTDLVPTLYGAVRLKNPPGPGQTLRLAGHGLPELGSSRRGDLFIHY